MTIYKVSDDSGYYTTSTFIVNAWNEIYCENIEIGFFKHPELNSEADLQEHLTKMADDGLTITVKRI